MPDERDLFEFIRSKSYIHGIPLDDLYALLQHDRSGSYTIKNKMPEMILINDSSEGNRNILLRCLAHVRKTKFTDCRRIREELGLTDVMSKNCADCYMKHIEQIRNGN